MSRRIDRPGGNLTEEELSLRRADSGRLIMTRLQGRLLTVLLAQNRLLAATLSENTPSKVGAVFIGKIKKIIKNIDACFVEIADGELCFLPFSECREPFLLNRSWNGRLVEGDELPVQVIRDPIKTKQAAVTANLSLAGRLMVFSLGPAHVGISGKISQERRRCLLSFLEENGLLEAGKIPQEEGMPSFGIILRTEAGAQGTETALLEEYADLRRTFTGWFRQAAHLACFSSLKKPELPYQAAAASFYTGEYGEVVTDLEDICGPLTEYLHMARGQSNVPVRLYLDESISLTKLYGLETRLKEALAPRVWLKSGGYLVIEPTEALTVIDVNTGKCVSGKVSQDTFFALNKEAAVEIALQLRLRNLSGIVLIDFINLESTKQQDELLGLMRQLVKKDHTKTTVVDITPLGLMEITRKRKNKTLHEQFKGIF